MGFNSSGMTPSYPFTSHYQNDYIPRRFGAKVFMDCMHFLTAKPTALKCWRGQP